MQRGPQVCHGHGMLVVLSTCSIRFRGNLSTRVGGTSRETVKRALDAWKIVDCRSLRSRRHIDGLRGPMHHVGL